jgi:hypothetical protein
MLGKAPCRYFIASFAVCLPSSPTKHPYYTFVFPDGYVGWFT